MSGKIIIRQANCTDIDIIMDFLQKHCRADYVFVTRPKLLEWQHLDPDDPNKLTFLTAVREGEQKDILALLGFMPYRRFDPNLKNNGLALAIWKVRNEVAPPGLGLQLLKFLTNKLNPEIIVAVGISEIVKPIYKMLGYNVGIMHHAALPVAKANYALLRHFDSSYLHQADAQPCDAGMENSAVKLNRVHDMESVWDDIDSLGALVMPIKSARYIEERFFNHPIYDYQILAVTQDSLKGIIIAREVSVKEARVLRIVDMIGDNDVLICSAHLLREYADVFGCEYVDVVQFGIDVDALHAIGFVDRQVMPELIIPNYFEPLSLMNVEVAFAFRESGDLPVRLFRADSDQDRPNLAKNVPEHFYVRRPNE